MLPAPSFCRVTSVQILQATLTGLPSMVPGQLARHVLKSELDVSESETSIGLCDRTRSPFGCRANSESNICELRHAHFGLEH